MHAKILTALAALGLAGTAHAAFPVYAPIGTPSATPNAFVSTGSGDVTAWFAGFDAGYSSTIGMAVNGVLGSTFCLPNKTTSVGTSCLLGSVMKGDTIEFVLRVANTGIDYSTTASKNPGGLNHAWSTPYAGGDFGIPAGIFVGFEDLPNLGDRDYNDHRFVFNFPGAAAVPEPATWAFLIAGFGLVGAAVRRRRTTGVASVAA
jgi:hypothetical protein